MAEYISRSKAEFELCEGNIPEPYRSFCRRVINDRNLIPTADVAPVRHGRWEFLGPNRLVKECMCGTCSACKIRSKYITNIGLCPNCGARMDGARNGDEKD